MLALGEEEKISEKQSDEETDRIENEEKNEENEKLLKNILEGMKSNLSEQDWEDECEIAAGKLILEVMSQKYEGYEDYAALETVKWLESTDTQCRMVMVLSQGKPLDCFEVVIDILEQKVTIEDFYFGDIEEDGSIYVYEREEGETDGIVGKTKDIMDLWND